MTLDKTSDRCQFPYCRAVPGDSGILLMGYEHCETHGDAVLIYMGREGLSLTEALRARSRIHKELHEHGHIAREREENDDAR